MGTIYYAHHIWKYDTKIEEYEIELIKKHFSGYQIINPNGDIIHSDLNDNIKIMEKCLLTVEQCNILIFSSVNGIVGRGVFDEVTNAFNLNKPIYYITNNQIIKISKPNFQVINESNRIYGIVRCQTWNYGN